MMQTTTEVSPRSDTDTVSRLTGLLWPSIRTGSAGSPRFGRKTPEAAAEELGRLFREFGPTQLT